MPRKNSRDRRRPGPYHVYNRGRDGIRVFKDDLDRMEFLSLVARFSRQYEGRLDVHCYCLMTSHYHLIVTQRESGAMDSFMRSLGTAYTKHHHKRHGTKGPLYAGPFRRRRLNNPKDFKRAVIYVHDNHPTGLDYRFSSHTAWVDDDLRPTWLKVEPALRVYGGLDNYKAFAHTNAE